ncbi:MAG: segregation/condensation protein A [Patescibacteria group bacterium]
MYEVRLEQFSGPLDLLLQLILQEELPINSVSLARVTGAYLEHLRAAEVADPNEMADFLVIAAKLLHLKSQTLLPTLESLPDEGPSLEAQLSAYRAFVEAGKHLAGILSKGRWSYPRTAPPAVPTFAPPKNLRAEHLTAAFGAILTALEPVVRFPTEAIRRVISIKEKIQRIQALVAKHAAITFRHVVGGRASKADIIVSFLALLELVKAEAIFVAQSSAFGELTLKKR